MKRMHNITESWPINCNYIVRVIDLMGARSEESLPIITIVTEMMENVCCR